MYSEEWRELIEMALTAAQWAAETAEVIELLTGKYGMDTQTAASILDTARACGSEDVTVIRAERDGRLIEGWAFTVGTDAGGFTFLETAYEAAPPGRF